MPRSVRILLSRSTSRWSGAMTSAPCSGPRSARASAVTVVQGSAESRVIVARAPARWGSRPGRAARRDPDSGHRGAGSSGGPARPLRCPGGRSPGIDLLRGVLLVRGAVGLLGAGVARREGEAQHVADGAGAPRGDLLDDAHHGRRHHDVLGDEAVQRRQRPVGRGARSWRLEHDALGVPAGEPHAHPHTGRRGGGVRSDRVLEGPIQVREHAHQAHARHRQLVDDREPGGRAQAGGPGRGVAARVARGGFGNRNGGGREEARLLLLRLPRRCCAGRGQRLCTATRSHTKISDSPGAMTGGAPMSP